MLFNSIDFVIFFPIVVFLFFSIPHKFRWALLLAASYYFYMCWKAEYIVLIVVSTLIDYFASLKMENAQGRKRKFYLAMSMFTNLGILFAFKYFNFFSDSFRLILEQFNIFYDTPSYQLLLPVGISFYTFQTMSYTIDVYKGKRKAEKHLGIFALFVAFFPQLVAGPIERSTRLLPQFYKKVGFNYDRVVSGLRLMLWGFFKKVVVADRLAILVERYYSSPENFDGTTLLMATYFFAVQIYCDFSGYSDIAIGSARIMGFDLMKNFNIPYYAKSIGEFWHRWHISLSTWFRDYVYIPLGGNRVSKVRHIVNIMVTFTVSGLWHGANWTFVVWGFLHGLYLTVEKLIADISKKVKWKLPQILTKPYALFKMFSTFLLVLLTWVFFRAENISQAFYIVEKIVTDFSFIDFISYDFHSTVQYNYYFLSQNVIIMIVLMLGHFIQERNGIIKFMEKLGFFGRSLIYIILIIMILLLGQFSFNQFIYFQF